MSKNRVNIVFFWHISSFFVYSDHHSRSFSYISIFSLSSSILSKLVIIRLLNSLILFISLHNLKISNTSRLTEYLFIFSTTLIKNDASQKDLNHRKWFRCSRERKQLTRLSKEKIHLQRNRFFALKHSTRWLSDVSSCYQRHDRKWKNEKIFD
jgi:hypothetical protein